MNRNLTDIEFYLVCNLLTKNMGLNFTAEKRPVLNRNLSIAARDLGFADLHEFIDWFVSPARVKTDYESLANYFTNSETSFWREAPVFTALTQDILPELIESKRNSGKKINIWCSGSSTGEEAYSIAIALYRTIPDLKKWHVTILASDINKSALTKARNAVYGEWSFRNAPLWLRNRYMTRLEGLSWVVNTDIKQMITFSEFNLIRESYPPAI